MKTRVLCVPVILLITLLRAFPTAQALAQDITITNFDQLAQVALSANYSIYLPFSPWDWRAYPTDWPLWFDSTSLSCLDSLPASTNVMTSMDWSNVPLLCVTLTKDVLSGVTTVQSSDSTDVVANIPAPSGYQPGANSSDHWPWDYYVQATNDPDSWGLTADQIPPPTVTLRTFLADSNAYYSVYESNLEAESTAAASSTTASGISAFRGLAMGDEYDLSGGSCPITSDASAFYVMGEARASNAWVTTTWQSCTDHVYIVQAESSLTPTSSWVDVAWMFGANQSTSWSDTNAPSFSNRFYRVVRGNPNSLNGGITYGWAVSYGLDPLDPSLATKDADGDGYSNWDEFLMGTNPTNTNDPITVYVDAANTNGVYDGSQANPFHSIQDAIESSVDVSSNLAIRVRPGKYYEPVSNLQYDPYSGSNVSSRQYLYIYAANTNWSLSTDPESHIIDTLGFQHRDLLLFPGAPSAPAVEFSGVSRARINGFTLRGGQGVYGGGVYASPINNGPIYISNCIIEKNGGSGTDAGGIYIQAGTNSMIYNTAVARNVGAVGAIYDVNGSRIWNCTIVSNTTLNATFGAVTGGSGAPNIRNSIIWSNGFDAIDLYFANADYSTFGSNESVTAGAHNLSVDPILVNILFGNYRLQAGSPVIGEGATLPIEHLDLYGNPRPLSGRFDIGANEYTDSLGDGIQDDWKIKNGLSLTVSQATQDPDEDGLNNLQEYNNNTNPNNPDTDSDGISDGPLAPTGSGLQPGPDPDPTTPDLVLNTVFWDYFFEDTFLMYVDGNPQWINLPPTAPLPVVLNGYHIGGHVTFQWQVLDDPSGEPYLVFYVPHTTLGNILPDVDATPVDQIQFGFGVFAPPDGPWGFTLAQTTPMNAEVCAGFDNETPLLTRGALPALSVPQRGTNTLTVVINPANVVGQILFQTTNSTTATASPSTAATATQLVSVAGLSTGNSITTNQLVVLGYGAQNTFTTTCSKVNIDILPQRTNITVALYSVSIKSSTGFVFPGPTNVPSNTELQSYLASLYGTQANVSFTVLPVTNVAVMYDTNENFKLDWNLNAFTGEPLTIYNAAHTSGTNVLNVYYVNALTNANAAQQAEGITYYLTFHASFIQDTHPSSSVNLTAHELGHSLANLPNTGGLGTLAGGVSGFPDQLMWYHGETNNPCRLIQREWEALNSAAQRPLP